MDLNWVVWVTDTSVTKGCYLPYTQSGFKSSCVGYGHFSDKGMLSSIVDLKSGFKKWIYKVDLN